MKIGRKRTGGRYKPRSKKKKAQLGRPTRFVKISKTKRKKLDIRGNKEKSVLLSCEEANVLNKKTGKTKVSKIETVTETSANKFWARQNRLVKGAIIETELGKAQITNRPGQEGCINAVLIEDK